ncbi:hypothetical protein ACHWQZ_G012606 [Mnemiopsis leidyi]
MFSISEVSSNSLNVLKKCSQCSYSSMKLGESTLIPGEHRLGLMSISDSDLLTLGPRRYVNDVIVDSWLAFLHAEHCPPSFTVVSVFFFGHLEKISIAEVQQDKWASEIMSEMELGKVVIVVWTNTGFSLQCRMGK